MVWEIFNPSLIANKSHVWLIFLFFWNLKKLKPGTLSGTELFIVGKFLIINLIFKTQGLFSLPTSLCVSCTNCIFQESWPFHLVCQLPITTLHFGVSSDAISSHSFQILFSYALFFFFLISLAKGVTTCFIFSKN